MTTPRRVTTLAVPENAIPVVSRILATPYGTVLAGGDSRPRPGSTFVSVTYVLATADPVTRADLVAIAREDLGDDLDLRLVEDESGRYVTPDSPVVTYVWTARRGNALADAFQRSILRKAPL